MNPQGEQQNLLRFAVSACLNLMLGVVLFIAAVLRETPMFWRNAGGFPVLLRDLVGWLFYPALVGFSFGLLVTTALAFQWPRQLPGRMLVWLAVIMLWILWLMVMMTVLWNNLNNWFSGAPLHEHPQ